MSHNKNSIDTRARQESKAIAAGEIMPHDEMHPKVALYGLLSQTLHIEQI